MIVTKFTRIGQVVRDEQNNVIPGSYRFTFWNEKKECSFKLGVAQIHAVAIQVELCEFTNKDGKTIEFYKFLQGFASATNLEDTANAVKAVDELDKKVKAMF